MNGTPTLSGPPGSGRQREDPVAPESALPEKVSLYLWRFAEAAAAYFGFVFFLKHSLGADSAGKTAIILVLVLAAVALALPLRPPRQAWAAPEHLNGARNLTIGVFGAFLAANAVLTVTGNSAFNRASELRTALAETIAMEGLYPASLEELEEMEDLPIPDTGIGFGTPRQFRYQRYGEEGDFYVLSFDAAFFTICSRANDDVVWQCDLKGSLPQPSSIIPDDGRPPLEPG